jgi:hypothetical protein
VENDPMTSRWILVTVVAACARDPLLDARAQLPPVLGEVSIEAWLDEGWYRAWTCEQRTSIGEGHGHNRICSNDLAVMAGSGEFPIDAASVKEMWSDDDTMMIGIAVARHTRAGAGGDTWYWYERVDADSPIPHDDRGIAANGWGDEGDAVKCVGCHRLAGSDANHSGHDMVYVVAR